MNIDLVLKRLELIKESKGINTISDVEASIILKEIENLHKIIDGMIDNEEEYCLENNRLNNIINELEKWLKKEIFDLNGDYDYEGVVSGYENVLNKLQELKGE